MPGDIFKHVNPGESLTIGADSWNAAMDAARAHKANKPSGGRAEVGGSKRHVGFKVENKTGDALERFYIVEIGDPLITPEDDEDSFPNFQTFEGIVPTGTDVPFAILQSAADEDDIVWAIGLGYSWVKVDFTDAAHNFCTPTDTDETMMTSAEAGPAEVIWREPTPDTGEKWAFVRMGGTGGSGGNAAILQVTDTTPEKNGDGTQDVVISDGGTSGAAAKIYNRNTSVAALPAGFYYGVLLTAPPTLTSSVPVYAVAYTICP